jgi:CHAT domain-containing protein
LANALAATDRALARDARYGEALFNRALMIERIGLRDDARDAWNRYLDVDSTGGWADEARAHVTALAPAKPFLEVLDGEYERAAKDSTAAATLVARDPFSARGMGVMEVLGRWGDAVTSGDEQAADRHLRVARQLGTAIVRRNGDRMLEQAVAAIDHAHDFARSRLAAAHVDYRRGIKAFQATRPGEAEPILRRTASEFAALNSPVAILAEHFAINAFYAQGHKDEAERQSQALLARVPWDFPSARALLLSQLGVAQGSHAAWGTAIRSLEESTALFESLGETQNVATQRRLLAFVYDRIDDRHTAWKYRLTALRGLGSQSSLMLAKTVSSIVDAAILHRDWHQAWSFVNLQLGIARRIEDRVQVADALMTRAVIRERIDDGIEARADLAEARTVAASVADPFYQQLLRVAELRTASMLATTPPTQAEAMLTEAIEFQKGRSDRLTLPGLFLQRARVRRTSGDRLGSFADVDRGIAELEQQRESLPAGEARWGAFHGAEELFGLGVELALDAGQIERAFRFAERSRARTLLESYDRSPELDLRRLSAGTLIIEYATLPTRLVIFTVTAAGVRATPVPIAPETLARDTEAMSRALRKGEVPEANRSAAIAYLHLIAPIETSLSDATAIVFVPDGATSAVPFALLRDARGSYLFERYPISVASGAAAFAAAHERRSSAKAPESVLVLSAPSAATGSGNLEFADAEARQIASLYRSATRIREDAAQLDELIRRAPEADVIHFGGHAIGDDRGFEPASIVVRQNGTERRVGVGEVAKLHLRRTATVILAGCSTARGESRAAEGVISVAHGFLSAGAPTVIATLWPIDDEASATFFPRLHRRLAEGMPPAQALREAQRESIQRGDVPMSLWAAVEDFGS